MNVDFYSPSLPCVKFRNLYPVLFHVRQFNKLEEIMEDKHICNILLYFLFTINRLRCLQVPILILLFVNTFTLSQAVDSKLKCSDDTFAQYFNCSSDCVYGEESLVSCMVPASKDIQCEVN